MTKKSPAINNWRIKCRYIVWHGISQSRLYFTAFNAFLEYNNIVRDIADTTERIYVVLSGCMEGEKWHRHVLNTTKGIVVE